MTLQETYSTRETAKILGLPSPCLDKAMYAGNCDHPIKDSSNRYRWTRIDIQRASWQLSKQKNFEAWEKDNPAPKPPAETTAELEARLKKTETRIIQLEKIASTHEMTIQRMLAKG